MTENGVKEDAKHQEPTALEQKIIRQIEYYYGDINLVKDKFLQQQIKEDEGWVTMETMLKFKRLLALSGDKDIIAGALRKSKSGLMEVNEDNTKIRRHPDKPIPDLTKDRAKSLKERTIYAKGFPLDSELDTLIEFFDEFGKTEHVFMRKDKERKFKGSCFVTYVEEEGAKKFLGGDEVKYKDTVLVRFSKDGYFSSKDEERKKSREEKAKNKEEKAHARQKAAEDKKEKDEEDFQAGITHGAILELTNIPADVLREDIKEIFHKHCPIAWQDFSKGEPEAKIRFEEENGAKVAWEKALEAGEGKVEIKGQKVEGRILEGSEEEEYWRDIQEKRKAKRDSRGGGGRRGGRGGGRGSGGRFGGRRGGGGHNRRRTRSEGDHDGDDGESKAKVTKFDDDGKPTTSSTDKSAAADSADKDSDKNAAKRHSEQTNDGEPAAKAQKTD